MTSVVAKQYQGLVKYMADLLEMIRGKINRENIGHPKKHATSSAHSFRLRALKLNIPIVRKHMRLRVLLLY